MKFLTLAAVLGLASSAAAVSGSSKSRRDSSNSTCLDQRAADDIVAKFITVLEHVDIQAANDTVQDLLSTTFFETSDSINTLQGSPVSFCSI